jgi:plasmid stabilization system protein ParE
VTSPNFKLRPYAEADVEGAVSYYFARGPQLAFRLLAELDVAFDRIRENPQQFAFVEEPVRRVLLRRFPYSIYYVLEDEARSGGLTLVYSGFAARIRDWRYGLSRHWDRRSPSSMLARERARTSLAIGTCSPSSRVTSWLRSVLSNGYRRSAVRLIVYLSAMPASTLP